MDQLTSEPLTDIITRKIKRVVIIIFLIFILLLGLGIGYFFYSLTPVDKTSTRSVPFVLESGWSANKVAEELEELKVIRNAFTFKLYIKFGNMTNFQAGTYILSKSMDANEIIDSLANGKNTISNTKTITFVEGKRFDYYAKKISQEFGYEYDDIIKKTSDEEYLEKLIKKYWFIDSEILNKDLYYPLEGYIFPDTYQFKNDATIEEIIEKMLDEMDSKLSAYKDEIELSGMKIHGLLTLASMVELEAVTPEDRAPVAGVFYNRIDIGMTLGSDVTTYYAAKKEMTEKLTMSELNACNAYNTRGSCVKGLPAGPICAPSYSSIIAAIEPIKEKDNNKYLYFMADANNKVYFSSTLNEQNRKISELKKQGLWPE